jgi:hypothetical protein
MVTKTEPVLWKPLIATSIIGLVGVFVLLPMNRKWSIILLMAILGIWTRVPGYYIPQISELQTVDFFTLMIALAYGPTEGFIFAIVVMVWSRFYTTMEYPSVSIKLGVAFGLSGVLAHFLFPIIPDFEALLTFLLIFEYLFFLIITYVFERSHMAIEIYYSVVLLPISYLHRLMMSFFGADYLFELMAHESGSLIWIYLFGIGIIGIILVMYWVNQKYDLSSFTKGLFDAETKGSITELIKRTGFNLMEAKDMIFAMISLSAILSVGQWLIEFTDIVSALIYVIMAINVVAFSYVLHIGSYKWLARKYGAYGEYKFYAPITIFSLLVGIVSKGKVLIPLLGTVFLSSKFFMRPGRAYVGGAPFLGPKDRARIMAMGPLVSVFLALLSRSLITLFGENILLTYLFRFNVWLAVISMLPLAFPAQAKYREIQEKFMPPFPGATILHGHKGLYVFLLAFVFIVLISINFVSVWLSVIIALILAMAIWIEFFRRFKESIK